MSSSVPFFLFIYSFLVLLAFISVFDPFIFGLCFRRIVFLSLWHAFSASIVIFPYGTFRMEMVTF